ncbi:MAG: hypothetical protein K0R16_2132 [Nitrososphaeraceae archaeon]|jgi:hypothetical protein|nr:hypothetical protein [Nitrososphaeraceae archaeon]MDF2769182.1 hypothetical protein [Nitrososphaeraceae archaeon]
MATYIEQQLPSFITDLFKMQLDSNGPNIFFIVSSKDIFQLY